MSRGERLDLTIDSGPAVCGLLKNSAQEVALVKPEGTPKEYNAANAQEIGESGSRTSTLEFQNSDVEKLKLQVMDIHKPLLSASKAVAAGNTIVLQPYRYGGSYMQGLTTKSRKKFYERNGVYALPS